MISSQHFRFFSDWHEKSLNESFLKLLLKLAHMKNHKYFVYFHSIIYISTFIYNIKIVVENNYKIK